MSEEHKEDFVKFDYKKIKEFFMNKRVQLVLTVLLLLIIIVLSTTIRLSNLGNLKDATTGNYTAADPDALYFQRLAHVVLEHGNLNGVDGLRAPGTNITYLKEFNPYFIVGIYKVVKIFSSGVNLDIISMISPVIFFILGLIVFFFLILYLTKSKLVGLLSSAFLAFSPAYLFRTMAGVLDHDALGMLGFFTTLLVFSVSIKKFEKSQKNTILWASLLGIVSAFAMGTWAGQMTFLFIIIPAAIFIHYLFNLEKQDDKKKLLIEFNAIWIIIFAIFAKIFGFSAVDIGNRLLVPSSILLLFVFGFMIIDYLIKKSINKIKFIKEDKRIFYSIALTLILGIIFFIIKGEGIFGLVNSIYEKLLSPFASGGRLGSTVSENAQPYLNSWTGQIGNTIFWMFYIGIIFISTNFAKKIKKQKDKTIFVLLSILMFLGILLSRISSSSTFNGETFLSQLFYAGSILAWGIYLIYLYTKERFEIRKEHIVIFTMVLFMIIFGRSAARTIFVATPFVCFSAAYALNETIKLTRKLRKNDNLKSLFIIFSVVLIILSIFALLGNPITKTSGEYQNVKIQASATGAAADYQWQYAMAWVRNNTNQDTIFIHWWDYGYLVQTLTGRKTVSDGGHAAGSQGDYNLGRYLLTTPWSDSALSYMKTWNVSYLVIDPTDLGKYAAYSKIGSDAEYDRYSSPTAMVQDDSQTVETSTTKTVVYTGTTFNDGDIIYGETFIPSPSYDENGNANYNSYVLGIILNLNMKDGSATSFNQPEAVFYYNGAQYKIPLRYIYYNGQTIDFSTGINATYMIIPSLSQDSSGKVSVNPTGAGIYLSPTVSQSLFAKLYLMDDPFNEYPTITIADSEDDYVVSYLKQQGYNLDDFIYYGGFRGPLKIWKVDYLANTQAYSEFLDTNFTYGGMDYLFE